MFFLSFEVEIAKRKRNAKQLLKLTAFPLIIESDFFFPMFALICYCYSSNALQFFVHHLPYHIIFDNYPNRKFIKLSPLPFFLYTLLSQSFWQIFNIIFFVYQFFIIVTNLIHFAICNKLTMFQQYCWNMVSLLQMAK